MRRRQELNNFSTPVRAHQQGPKSDANLSPIAVNSMANLIKIKKASFLEMAIEAIEAVAVPRKGASYQAIKKWIIANKEVDNKRMIHLKLALRKGIESEMLVRPKNSDSARGVNGCYMLPKTKPVKIPIATAKKPALPKQTKTSSNANKMKLGAESEKTNAKTVVQKKAIIKMPPKAKVQKKPATTIDPESKTEKAKVKVPSKYKVGKKRASMVAMKAGAGKKSATKVSMKAGAGKKPATKAPMKADAGKKPATKAPMEAGASKKPATKAPIKSDAGKMPSNDINAEILDENINISSGNNFYFSESDEDATSKAPENQNAKAHAKNQTVLKSEKKVKDQSAVRIAKKRGTKAIKSLKSPDKTLDNAVAMNRNKKLYNSTENELNRQELSDTEVTVKKNRLNALKSCSSDTELEVSKREEKRAKEGRKKLPIRAKKVPKA